MIKTLLELTQDILSDIDGDQVNSISDTVESLQVVTCVKQAYYDILEERNLMYVGQLTTLTGLADLDKPNYMGIPENFVKLEWIKYDVRNDEDEPLSYKDVDYMEPECFVEHVNNRPSDDTDNFLTVYHEAGVPLIIAKYVGPRYWTSFDDKEVVFDSYDADLDSTLQSSKCQVYAYKTRVFVTDDDFVPDIPPGLFQYLTHKATAHAHSVINHQLNPKAEQKETRGRTRSQRADWVTNRHKVEGVDYGKQTTSPRSFKRRTP